MKKVEAVTWESDDGIPFDTEQECIKYEARMKFAETYRKMCDTLYRPDGLELAEWLEQNRQTVLELLLAGE